jgi:hypothetical protein
MAKTKGKVIMNFEVTPKEREYIKYLAKLHGLKTATYVRMRAMTPIDREEET